MRKFFNFQSLLFKILFSYILISVISLMVISLSLGYFLNKQTYNEEKRNLFKKSEKIYSLLEMVRSGIMEEAEFDKNLKTIEISDDINIEKIKEKQYFKGLEVYNIDGISIKKDFLDNIFIGKEQFDNVLLNKEKYGYMILGTPVYDKKGINGATIIYIKMMKNNNLYYRSYLLSNMKMVKKWNEMIIAGESDKKEYNLRIKSMKATNKIGYKYIKKNDGKGLQPIFNGENTIIDKKTVSAVLKGQKSFTVNTIDETGTSYLIYGIPTRDKQNKPEAIFLFTSIKNLNDKLSNIYFLICLTFLVISIPTILILYLVSKKYSKPLIQMSEIADRISHGDFSDKVVLQSNDEIGMLANSINNMADWLKRLEAIRKDFIANISHELRAPLTTIRANTQGLIDGVIEESEREQYLNVTMSEIKRLMNLVNELIELSIFDKGSIKLNIENTDISKLIRETVKQMEMKALEKEILIKLEIQENEILGEIDSDRIKQVLINILDNAIKYTPKEGKINVLVTKLQEDLSLNLVINDSGCGISEENIQFIFRRFSKINKHSGTGIGLSITKHIIEAHGGEISVKSRVGIGTTFFIKLPI